MAFQRAANVEDVPVGEVRVFRVDGVEVAVANVGGTFYAIDDVCSHDGGPLGEGRVFGDQVECPRHGARFDVKTGRPRTLPAVMPVRTFPVEVEGNEIKVDTDGA
jgi:3-phenylpropionate/trans-cinnamate dioxygenase ferredoxin subunit